MSMNALFGVEFVTNIEFHCVVNEALRHHSASSCTLTAAVIHTDGWIQSVSKPPNVFMATNIYIMRL